MMAHLSWMERATLLQEQLGLSQDPNAGASDEPTRVADEPTLEFRTEYLSESDIGDPESGVYGVAQLAEAETAQEVRDDELFTAEPQQAAPLPSERARRSELEIPDFRRRQLGPKTVLAVIGTTIAIVAASVANYSWAPYTAAPVSVGTAHDAKAPAPPQAPAARQAAPPAPSTPAPSEATMRSASPLSPAGTSPATGAAVVAVTVKVIPAGAVVFRAGKKLGSGSVGLSVERNTKQRLTALYDGYAPYNFTVDGSRDTVTVRLKPAFRVPAEAAATAHGSDSPLAESRDDANKSAATTPTAASAPESAPRAPKNPNAAGSETPVE